MNSIHRYLGGRGRDYDPPQAYQDRALKAREDQIAAALLGLSDEAASELLGRILTMNRNPMRAERIGERISRHGHYAGRA